MPKNKTKIKYRITATTKTKVNSSAVKNYQTVIKKQDEYKEKNFNWCINLKYLYKNDDNFSFYKIKGKGAKHIKNCITKLESLRVQTWRWIERSFNDTSNGIMEIRKLEKDIQPMVQEHLKRINYLDDILYKIEINNNHRLWGIRIDDVLQIIWDDNGHHFYKHKNKNYSP